MRPTTSVNQSISTSHGLGKCPYYFKCVSLSVRVPSWIGIVLHCHAGVLVHASGRDTYQEGVGGSKRGDKEKYCVLSLQSAWIKMWLFTTVCNRDSVCDELSEDEAWRDWCELWTLEVDIPGVLSMQANRCVCVCVCVNGKRNIHVNELSPKVGWV